MHRIAFPLAAVVAVALAAPLAAQQKIKVGTESVPVYVTVTDQTKRLVTDLTEDDFEVFDNGKPQKIDVFDNKPTPITVVVMLDTSGSMTLGLDRLKDAAEQFVLRLEPGDLAQVGEFNDKIRFHPGTFVDDRDQLIYELKNNIDFGDPTRLWDAVDESVDKLESMDGRRVVLVFTDGDDNASKTGLNDVTGHARQKDVMVYAIGFHSVYSVDGHRVETSPDRRLKGLAAETGGGYFELRNTDDLGATFTRVAEELHSQYVLGFTPETPDGKVHKLDVRVKKAGMTVQARKSYLAPAPSGT
ncbi:MAG: VWA domain-containing protein [Vicinamibacterales bacterium]